MYISEQCLQEIKVKQDEEGNDDDDDDDDDDDVNDHRLHLSGFALNLDQRFCLFVLFCKHFI